MRLIDADALNAKISNSAKNEVPTKEPKRRKWLLIDYVLSALGNGDAHFLNGIKTAQKIVKNAPTICVRCGTKMEMSENDD